tara:strand:+ start:3915 stop:5894 length:1980 start_codon:yes stop_codon:yes gene_type:complete
MKQRRDYKSKRVHKKNQKELIGYFQKPKGSHTHCVVDRASEEKFKIGKSELRKAFPGDLVRYHLTPKGWASIDSVLKSNTKNFIGKITRNGKVTFSSPVGLEDIVRIKITGDIPKKISTETLVEIILTKQPAARQMGEGYIKRTISEDNILEIASALSVSKHDLRTEWNKSIIQESQRLAKTVIATELNYVDLRNKSFITIDGKTAKDFDDAVFSEKNESGDLVLYVAIADVGKFVTPYSAMDKEAAERGTSVYFTQKVIPMLPEIISNDLCSLRPKEDRYCLVCKTSLSQAGESKEVEFFQAIINSKSRLTYERVAEQMKINKFSDPYAQSLKNLVDIYKILKKAKKNRGALELDIPFYVPQLKGNKIEKFINTSRNEAHLLIEECMLLANICAAKILMKAKIPSIYRIHPKPDPLKIKNLEGFARSRKINVTLGNDGKVKELSNLVDITKDRKDKETIHMQILQSLSLAVYETEVSEHFALGYPAYTHFTSPIRRYPDLMVHRALKSLIQTSSNGKISLNKIRPQPINKDLYPYNNDLVEEIASLSSTKEREAEKAEREAINYLKCAYAKDNIGKEFNGVISGVTNFGLFIHLDSIHIEGLCHIKHLPRREYYEFDENSKMLKSTSSNHCYSLGDSLLVKIKDADLTTQRIDIEIVK